MTASADPDYLETLARQRASAAPEASAWLSANAGSGKTRVLTDRVIRLLLAGAIPSRILGITFTKAAAAEMANRLFERLGEWALMDDADLVHNLRALTGDEAPVADLAVARRLFARALETPGGLKIQTIHSFCESILRRFPREAGLSPGFQVLTDVETERRLEGERNRLFSDVWPKDDQLSRDISYLTAEMSEKTFTEVLSDLAPKAIQLGQVVEENGGLSAVHELLRQQLGAPGPDENPLDPITVFVDDNRLRLTEIRDVLNSTGGKNNLATATAIAALLERVTEDSVQEKARPGFLTLANAVKKNLATKPVEEALPGTTEILSDLGDLIVGVIARLHARAIFERTKAFHRLVLSLHGAVTAWKQRHSALDFDDLIRLTARLFDRTDMDWVHYKLDQGIDHILVDEAQDTSHRQWAVIDPLTENFFAGLDGHLMPRSIFVVGDEKQSIYSFQGADVDVFAQKQEELRERIETSGSKFTNEELILSFRSTEPILSFVDTLFALDGVGINVGERIPIRHQAFRKGRAGIVELWPLHTHPDDDGDEDHWAAPVDRPAPGDPARMLAEEIATTIRNWLDTEEKLVSRDRKIEPRDIMILCQRRGPVFHNLVRALRSRNIPTAGADRLKLLEDICVMDMRSFLRWAMQPGDDLSLAEVLKSPLYGFDDDTDLFSLCHDRNKQTLFARLEASGESRHRVAATELSGFRDLALAEGPYAALSGLLDARIEGGPSGWQRFFARIGPGAREPLEELLAEALTYERTHPRNIVGFLSYLDELTTELKKEIDGRDNFVRLMTVHGAKGLEAGIVFLADADNDGRGSNKHPLIDIPLCDDHDQTVPVHRTNAACDAPVITQALAADQLRQQAEYRRLLYVAATRAEDRLYICGVEGKRRTLEKILEKPNSDACWYALAYRAFEQLLAEDRATEHPHPTRPGSLLRFENPDTDNIDKEEVITVTDPDVAAPPWLTAEAPVTNPSVAVRPSQLADILESDGPSSPVFSPLGRFTDQAHPDGRVRGKALHLLLEKLPALPVPDREAAARRLLTHLHPSLSMSVVDEWIGEVRTILDDPSFGPVFSPGSRAEVAVQGDVRTDSGTIFISGQIDRLVVNDTAVLIIDYKSNRPPPDDVHDAPAAYLAQLAAYRALLEQIHPDKDVSCALVWTWTATLMPVPSSLLDHAFVHHVASRAVPENG